MAVNWVSNGNEDLERTAVPQGNDDSSSRSSSSGVIIASSSRSETSHSSDLSSTPLTDLPRSNQIKDRNSLLQNLSNYQAIGCLRLRTHEFVTQQQEILSGWQEVTEGRQLVPDDVVLRAGLIKLLDASWIRLTCKINPRCHDSLAVRVYVLPDDVGRTFIARSCNVLRKHLRRILESIDKSPSTWDSEFDPQSPVLGICPEAPDVGSLFYLFNTLPSPSPCPERIRDRLLRSTVEDLLCFEKPLDGLKTNLLPYQRRSAAMMVEKEICPRLTLDPRLQEVSAPDQSVFYFDQDGSSIFRHRREYEGPRGGILAETMGLGKTLICLAVIMASRDQAPQIPPEFSENQLPIRKSVGSLLEMCAATIWRHSIPFSCHFDRLLKIEGIDYSECREAVQRNKIGYHVPAPVNLSLRSRRISAPGRTIHLSAGTIIVCPANLAQQWSNEINKHCNAGSLNVLFMDSNDKRLPDLSELLTFDIVLFSRTRFEKEERDERMPNENVTSEPVQYNSPLKNIHWKRIIIDEGHSMGQAKTQALVMADKLIVENRWVVSGTPANSMIGVEVGMAANQSQDGGLSKSPNIVIAQALALRKAEESIMQDRKDLERIGVIATKFLKVRPWANSLNDDPASWARFITPRDVQSPGLSPLRATSYCLQATLESLIIKHRAEDVDVDLPPLNNKLVYLEPSFYDTLSINLFIQAIVANAITSEREDSDYLFHPKNRNELNRLVNNLRQSGFFWTGYSKEEVQQTMAVSQQYLDKEGTKCTQSDRQLLTEAVDVGHVAVADSGWTSFSHFHELGLSVAHFPNDTRTEWALDHCDSDPLLMGITQLLKAQKHVNSQLYAPDPGAGLAAVGKVAMVVAQATASKFNSQDSVKRLTSVSSSPVRIRPKARSKKPLVGEPNSGPQDPGVSLKPPAPEAKGKGLKSALKISHTPTLGLPQDSPLSKTCIVGVASSKLAYLIDRVLRLHRQEKILIAYEGEDVAFYIAQALEIVGVKHLIYATSLKAARRAQYIVTFNTTETFRVLLMDVHQASHGLNLSSASRVFFVNPVWQPNVEAQAIKRAHRIGQTRPVYVETLILKNTLDDKMLQRRRNMSHDEHERTQKSLLDDRAMTKMIQDLTFLPINTSKELSLEHKMAKLSTPHQVFGQVGWTHAEGDEGLIDVQSSGPTVVAKSKRKRVAVAFGGDEDLDTAGEPTNIGTEPRKVQRNAKSVMMGETDLIPNDRCNSSVVTESSLDPTSSHPATPTPRRARFALPNEEEVSGPSTETDSQLTSQPVRRSLFGGGGENSPEPSSGSMAARTPTSTTD